MVDSIWSDHYIDEATINNVKFEGRLHFDDSGLTACFITKSKYDHLITENLLKCKGYEYIIDCVFIQKNGEMRLELTPK